MIYFDQFITQHDLQVLGNYLSYKIMDFIFGSYENPIQIFELFTKK